MIPAHVWSRHSVPKGASAVDIRPEEVVGILPGRHSGRLPKIEMKLKHFNQCAVFSGQCLHPTMNELIRLNVGGERYTTTRATVTRCPDSMLGKMFGGTMATSIDEHGCFFIDRDGPMFRYVLNFLRSGRLSLPADFNQLDLLADEADFYQLEDLIKEISRLRASPGGSYLEVCDVSFMIMLYQKLRH